MTKLKLLTYNMRGLATRQRRVKARILLESLQARPDVICIQEHKLRTGRLTRISHEVWAGAHWLCAPAAEGIHAIRNPDVEAGRGGVALGIGLDLVPFISQEGISICGRAVWICIIHPIWGRLGIVGAYGPNTGEGRTAL